MTTMPPERDPEDPEVLVEWAALHTEATSPDVEVEIPDEELEE